MPFYIIAGIIAMCGMITHFTLDETIENESEDEITDVIPQVWTLTLQTPIWNEKKISIFDLC